MTRLKCELDEEKTVYSGTGTGVSSTDSPPHPSALRIPHGLPLQRQPPESERVRMCWKETIEEDR